MSASDPNFELKVFRAPSDLLARHAEAIENHLRREWKKDAIKLARRLRKKGQRTGGHALANFGGTGLSLDRYRRIQQMYNSIRDTPGILACELNGQYKTARNDLQFLRDHHLVESSGARGKTTYVVIAEFPLFSKMGKAQGVPPSVSADVQERREKTASFICENGPVHLSEIRKTFCAHTSNETIDNDVYRLRVAKVIRRVATGTYAAPIAVAAE